MAEGPEKQPTHFLNKDWETKFMIGSREKAPPKAFTLIELLVVIAIVLILVTLALPNFLNALTQSRVARAMAELRSLNTAVQSYFTDHKSIPLSADENGLPIIPYPPIGFGPEVFQTRLSSILTSPSAYIQAIPHDPFASDEAEPDDPRAFEGATYHYGTAEYALANDGFEGAFKFALFARLLGAAPESIHYYLASHGPDYDHDDDEVSTDIDAAAPYSPTNGTGSSGDLVYLGPSHGFAH